MAYSRRSVIMTVLLTTLAALPILGRDKRSPSPCDKPREIASQPKFSKEQAERARKIKVQGVIDISINEDGDITDAKVVKVYSPQNGDLREAVDLLLAFARSATFKPRTGCGVTHTKINFTFAGGQMSKNRHYTR